ncbi:MAG: leucine-rich repeat domain-containing protein [Clostridia bacterium]|nr:leucine-rich repeat domain-containing protein [Clostridia bacterium]
MSKVIKHTKVVLIAVLCLALSLLFVACGGDPPHEHAFTQQITNQSFIVSDATCTTKAKYYYSCECGQKGVETFEYGEILGHSFTNYVSDNNATCNEDGTETATCARSGCNEKSTRKQNNTALNHNYNTPTYEWNGDKCTATRVCDRDSAHVETETVTAVYVKDSDANCLVAEKGHYRAAFSNVAFSVQETSANSITVGDPTGHNFGAPTYSWSGDKCTATRVCDRDSTHVETETVTAVYVKDSDATCLVAEKGHYKATFNNIAFSVQETAANGITVGDPVDHNFSAPTYSWNGDKCTATRVCVWEASHVETETVTAVYVKDSDVTCLVAEKGHYKATFSNVAFSIKETATNSITVGDPMGHSFGIPTYSWSGDKCTATRVCDRDSTHVETETVTAVYVKDSDATCVDNEKGHYVATFAANTEFVEQKTNDNSVEIENSALGHDWGDGETTKEATCIETGEKLFTCHCGETKTEIIEKTAHDTVKKVIEATCSAPGYTVEACKTCSFSDFTNFKNSVAHSGTRICDNCNKSFVDIVGKHIQTIGTRSTDSSGVRYGITVTNGTFKYMAYYHPSLGRITWWVQQYNGSQISVSFYLITTASSDSCEWHISSLSNGVATMDGVINPENFYYSTTSLSYQKAFPASGNWISSARTAAASGVKGALDFIDAVLLGCPDVVTIDNFGFINYFDSNISEHKHIWAQVGSYTESTCTTAGSVKYRCCLNNCSVSKTETISAHGHIYAPKNKTQTETCTQIGIIEEKCYVCSHVKTTEVDKLPHDYNDVVTAPTCEEKGYTTHTCLDCGDVLVDTYVDELGHSMTEHFTFKQQSCTETGVERYTCTNGACDYYEDETIPMDDHDYEEIAGEEGYITKKCKNCPDDFVLFIDNDIEYMIENDEATVVSYSGNEEIVKIPSIVNGHSVTAIAQKAFYNCTETSIVIIPSNVSNICSNAFEGCINLKIYCEATSESSGWDSGWNDGVKAVYWGVIMDNQGIEYTIANNAAAVKLCHSNTKIIEIPSSVNGYPLTTIEQNAFYNCSSLTSIVIPNSVTSIGSSAFSGCSSLTSIIILSSVTSIGSGAFSGCSNLRIYCEVTSKPSGWDSSWSNGSKCVYWGSLIDGQGIEYKIINNCASVKKYHGNGTIVEIPSIFNGYSVTTIEREAFSNCSHLASIIIPFSVTSIGSYAFSGCSSLEMIELPFVGQNADGTGATNFGYIFDMRNADVPSSLKKVVITGGSIINSYAFEDCSSLTSIVIPNSVTSIDSSAFRGCSSLESIEIPASITSIGSSAFSGCSSLESIEIPAGVTSIEEAVFAYCSSLTSVEIPASITSIGERAFRDCSSLTSIVVPNNVTSIGTYAFTDCTSLESITLPFIGDNPNGSGTIDIKNIFDYRTYAETLKKVVITGGSSIRSQALQGCGSLTSVVIPNSVTSIGSSAFLDCSSLESVTFGEKSRLTSIDDAAFGHCISLISIEIPSSVKIIGEQAFYNCSSLKNVTFGDNSQLTSIDQDTFYNCSNLISIIMPSSVTSIGWSAFGGCSSLESVTFGENSQLTTINNYAFRDCNNLTSIVMPSSVTSIGEYAFENCISLTIYCLETGEPSAWGSNWNGNRPVYWYSETQPTTEGNYWHYVDGVVTNW